MSYGTSKLQPTLRDLRFRPLNERRFQLDRCLRLRPDINDVLKRIEKAGRQSGYPEKSSECAPINSASDSVASAYGSP